ncbi:MAG TPA: hypothetical protein VIO13_02545 [Candidatus Dormibacteraeota bacterium]
MARLVIRLVHDAGGVDESNAGAVRFYEREGFRPFYRNMLAAV